jgi:hypothetical protein
MHNCKHAVPNQSQPVTQHSAPSSSSSSTLAFPTPMQSEPFLPRLPCPTDVVVFKEGTIVVADIRNQILQKIVGLQVTTLSGGSEVDTANSEGAAMMLDSMSPFGRAFTVETVIQQLL